MQNYLLKGLKIKDAIDRNKLKDSLIDISELANEGILKFSFVYSEFYRSNYGNYIPVNLDINVYIPNDDINEIVFDLGYIYRQYNTSQIIRLIENINRESTVSIVVIHNNRGWDKVLGIVRYKNTIDRFDGQVFCNVINERAEDVLNNYYGRFIELMGED